MITPQQDTTNDRAADRKKAKDKLKAQMRIRKYGVRQYEATKRGQLELLDDCQQRLEDLTAKYGLPVEDFSLSHDHPARAWLQEVYQHWSANIEADSSKQERNEQARVLLGNMHKGTQQLDMFDNRDALLGYTRHKFSERALLAVYSCVRLEGLWSLDGVRSVCSIGCGPGCDAVGALAYARSIGQRLERIVFLDWAMPQWKDLMTPIEDFVQREEPEIRLDMASANARLSLDHEENMEAREMILGSSGSCDIDLFLASYLLSETRGDWPRFFDTLWQKAEPGALFLLSDPTAWQLHQFIDRYPDCDVRWVDSSRDHPDLQALDNRVGPATVFVRKRRE